MRDIFDPLSNQSIWMGISIAVFLYLALVWGIRKFLKPATLGDLDPLNLNLFVFTGTALVGLLLTPFLTQNFSESFFWIIFFLCVWLVIIRLIGKPRKIDFRDKMGVEFQYSLLSLTVLFIVLNVIFNMIIPGTIPLLTEGGLYSRFEATQNSRLLSWLSMGISPMPGVIFALTQNDKVRKFAIFSLIIGTISSLLFASKGAIVSILFILINAMLVAKLRNETARYKKIRKGLVYCAVLAICLIPVYFSIIGFGDNEMVLFDLAMRFLGGFDQLIWTSQMDLMQGNHFGSLIHVNLVEYQLMPVFKVILSKTYDYFSIGQYVLQKVTGTVIDGPFTFPNSNLILETVFTSGTYLGFIAFVLELTCFYWCRFIAMKKPVTPFSLLLMYGMFFQPAELFYSGQEWFNYMIVAFATIVMAGVLAMLWISAMSTLRLAVAAEVRSSP